MCGRFVRKSDLSFLQRRFRFSGPDDRPNRESYNVAPTQEILVVRNRDEGRIGEYMHWGLIPFWAKDRTIGYRMINAKAETLADKPAFRNAFKRRRCLVLADGFFEWGKAEKGKQPYYVHLKSGEPFAMAGLWEEWTDKATGEIVRSATIITTEHNELMEEIHNRMPVIMQREAEGTWLDTASLDAAEAGSLLTPYPAAEMDAYPVSSRVNSPKNNTPECIAPLGAR